MSHGQVNVLENLLILNAGGDDINSLQSSDSC